MLNCREATQLISKSFDGSLPLSERLAVRIHLLVCRACTRYQAHLRFLTGLVRDRMRVLNGGESITGLGMPPADRERIRNVIAGWGKPPG